MSTPPTTATLSMAAQRRRSQRVTLALPVVLTSQDPAVPFKEDCVTVMISPLGCSLRSPRPLEQGVRVLLEQPRRNLSTIGRVAMGARPAKEKGSWEMGVEFEVASNFWGIEFPGADWQTAVPGAVTGAKDDSAAGKPAATPKGPSPETAPLASPATSAPQPAPAQARPAAPPAPPAVPAPAVPSLDGALAGLEPALRERARAISTEFESDYRKSLGELLLRLRADLEERTSADWERLQNQARASFETMVLQARREADPKLESRPVQASESELEAVLEQELGAQLKNLAGAVVEQLKPAREQLMVQVREDLQGLVAQVREQEEEVRARQAGRDAALEARAEATLQARDYMESLARTLPQIVDQRAQEAVSASVQLAQDRWEEQFSPPRLAQRLVEAAEPAAGELRQKLFEDFDRYEREFLDRVSVRVEEATAAAGKAREYVQQWQSELAGRLEQSVADSRGRLEEMVARREQQAQSALHKMAEHAGKAEAAAEHLRTLLDLLQEERRKLAGENQELRRQSEEVRAWLKQERDEIQKVMHGAVAEARGEIRGRLHQGVETLQDLIESRCRESASRLEEIAGRQSKELAEKLEQARERLHTLHDETQKAMGAKLNTRLAEVLGRFQQETDKLAQDTITECQADMSRILDSTKLP